MDISRALVFRLFVFIHTPHLNMFPNCLEFFFKYLSSSLSYRLQQDRLEAARIAEEMARKAAEEAVRQLEVEHSAKIIIDTLPESNEP